MQREKRVEESERERELDTARLELTRGDSTSTCAAQVPAVKKFAQGYFNAIAQLCEDQEKDCKFIELVRPHTRPI
jgi:hypothetical protein